MTFNKHIIAVYGDFTWVFCIDNIISGLFDTFKSITVERLIVHTRGLHARLYCCFFLF